MKGKKQYTAMLFVFSTVFHYFEPARIERTIAERDHMQKMVSFSFIHKGLSSKAKLICKFVNFEDIFEREAGRNLSQFSRVVAGYFHSNTRRHRLWSVATLVITS